MTVPSATSPYRFAPQDYVPGGGAFRAGSGSAAPQAVDLRETGTTEIAASDSYFGDDGPSFADLIDVINPLQHLPVVGQLYRAVTGDAIAPAAQVAGGSLYGGVAGLFVAVGSAFLDEAAGDDMRRGLAGLFGGAGDAPVQVAEATPAQALPGAQAPASAEALELKAALADGDAAKAALPAQANAPMAAAGAPQLSPQAFQALMTSIGATPAEGQAPAAGLTSGSDGTSATGTRAAQRELHETLKNHAAQHGLALPTVRR